MNKIADFLNTEFRFAKVEELTKLTKNQTMHLCQTGVIKPHKDIRGRGKNRVFNGINVIEFMICRELLRVRIETHTMGYALENLRSEFFLYTKGDKVKSVSFWKLLELDPKTKRTCLTGIYQTANDIVVYTVEDLKTVNLLIKNGVGAHVVLDIRKLINEIL